MNVLPNSIEDGLSALLDISTTSSNVASVGFKVILSSSFIAEKSDEFGKCPLCITNQRKASKSSALANLYTSVTPSSPKYISLPKSDNGLMLSLFKKSIDSTSISIPYS